MSPVPPDTHTPDSFERLSKLITPNLRWDYKNIGQGKGLFWEGLDCPSHHKISETRPIQIDVRDNWGNDHRFYLREDDSIQYSSSFGPRGVITPSQFRLELDPEPVITLTLDDEEQPLPLIPLQP